MTPIKLTKIGNSKGVRLNKQLLNRYKFGDFIEVDELPDGLLLRAPSDHKLSWEEIYKEMAESNEDWSDWDAVSSDGLDESF